MKKLAIFDLDHTLLSANSSYQFALYLYRTKQLSITTLLSVVFSYVRQRLFHTPLLTMHQQHFDHLFKGKSLKYFEDQVAAFVAEFLPQGFYKPVLDRLKQRKADDYHLVVMSGSPRFLVEPIAKYAGADEIIATDYAVDKENHFSHITRVMDGVDKAAAAAQLASKFCCSLSDIEAYSDSHLDLPLLQYTGKAIGVNPNNKLRTICNKNGWEVL